MKILLLSLALVLSTVHQPAAAMPIDDDNDDNRQILVNVALIAAATCGAFTMYYGLRWNDWKACWKYDDSDGKVRKVDPVDERDRITPSNLSDVYRTDY